MTEIDIVPLIALELAEPGSTSRLAGELIAIEYGNRREVSLNKLHEIDPKLASDARKVWDLQRDFFINKTATCSKSIKIKRTIILSKQQDTVHSRKDLKHEITKLLKSPVGSTVRNLLSSAPDFEKISNDLAKINGSIVRDGVWSTITFTLPSRISWDEELGGFYSPGEIEREFTLVTNHAPWRDRKNRRLVSIKVSAVELWVK